jgi:adenine-specific DNA-methyltransferase
MIDLYKINIGDPIYIMDQNESNTFRENEYLKDFYKNSDIRKFSVRENTNKKILYIHGEVALDEKLKNHLEPFKEILKDRREVKTGSRKWYELQWPRSKDIFENEKIVAPQRSSSNIFGYSDSDFYGSADIYYITSKNLLMKFPLLALLGLLNS